MCHLGESLVLLLSSFIGLSICYDTENPLSHRIVGGSPTTIDKFPHMLSLELKRDGHFTHWCGASIISNLWALTACHCVDRKRMNDIRLRAGSSFRERDGQVHLPQRIIKHPSYNARASDYDVAVIKVSSPFRFSNNVKAIPLSSQRPAVGTTVLLTGWGKLGERQSRPAQLQQVELKVINSRICSSAYPKNSTIQVTDRMFCASVHGHIQGFCSADSGGPLISGGRLVGITSWGGICGRSPGGYMDVSFFRQWISTTTGIH